MELPGCGPFIPAALFTFSHQPEKPEAEFARGQLGVLLPSYTRDHLIIAYRYLEGIGLSDQQRQSIYAAPRAEDAIQQWLDARTKVPGAARIERIDPFRTIATPQNYENYLNCNDDAFRTAAATLARIQKTNAAGVKEWLDAQDQVFTNCSGGPAIPAVADDPERRYQIAAAHFYAGQFDSAAQEFSAIVADAKSPWRGIAPYLAARCAIRKHDYAGAQKQLEAILADPGRKQLHSSARGLIAYVRAKSDPPARLHELARAITDRNSTTLAQDAIDYHFLLDHDVKSPAPDDVTEWILNFQGTNKDEALAHWRKTKSTAWMISAIAKIEAGDPAAAELIAAARAIQPASPAYASAAWHAARLQPAADARKTADEALATQLPVSARNLFRAIRMRQATSFEDWLRFTTRTSVGEAADVEGPTEKPGDYLDSDSTYVLSRLFPTRAIEQAAASSAIPEIARQDLRNVLFVRSLVLSAQPPKADDLMRLLRTPGLRAYPDTGYGRFTKEADKIDSFRDNWWCKAGKDDEGSFDYKQRNALTPPVARLGVPQAPFLSAAEKAEAAANWKKLTALPAAPTWMGTQVLDWAKREPDDPRLAEALHLVVRATRHGCTDEDNRRTSQAAFNLLHRRFPNSEWAKKTPYYF